MVARRTGDPELGGFRPLTITDIRSWPGFKDYSDINNPKLDLTDSDPELYRLKQQVKRKMPTAQFMCVEKNCKLRKGIARHWYNRSGAEKHQRKSGHVIVRI